MKFNDTGAAGAVAADLLAPKQAKKLAVIGTGIQGKIQTEGILLVRPGITEVRCLGHSGKSLSDYKESFKDRIDTKGKSELDKSVLQIANIFVDDEHQSRTIGELQGIEDCVAVEIGSVLLGKNTVRQPNKTITVFDSTGLALQDLTTAKLALQLAKEQGIGTVLHW